MSTTSECSITLEPKLAAEIARVAGPENVAAFVNDVLRQRLQAIRLRQLLDEMEQEAGPIPPDVQAEVDALEWPD